MAGATDPACQFTMTPDGAGKFYGRDPAAPAVPPYLVVTASDPTAVPATTPTPIAQSLADVLKVTRAQFAKNTNTLVIQARSSDQAFPPKITALGLGVLTPATCAIDLQRLETVLPGEPPAFVTLVSSGGGRKTEPVNVVPTAGGANTAPAAANDTATTPEDTPAVIAVLANDTDAECDQLSVTGVSNAVNGAAVVNANGTVTFTPTLNFNGTAGFDYAISDGNGGTASASVTVTVTAVNDAPVAVNDTATTKTRIAEKMKELDIAHLTHKSIVGVAQYLEPFIRGWVNYYGRFRMSARNPIFQLLRKRLVMWVRKRYKRYKTSLTKAYDWLKRVKEQLAPGLFYQWRLGFY